MCSASWAWTPRASRGSSSASTASSAASRSTWSSTATRAGGRCSPAGCKRLRTTAAAWSSPSTPASRRRPSASSTTGLPPRVRWAERLSFAEVIQYSSNIGATKVGERLGRERFHRYLRAFGFGDRTGIELPGETPGIVRPVQRWTHVDLATLSFGQGVSVTPVQMAAAFAAIANGGTLLRPFVVKRVVAPDGEVVLENEPTAVRRVVSTRSARTTTELLRRVVEHEGGTGTKARLEDFPVAGKTGTAQKVDPSTGVYSSKRIGSFVGFVPADEPRAVILVLIDEPSTSSYGGVVAAPVFRAIAAGVLKRLGVEPPAPIVLARAPRGAPQKPGARRARTAAASSVAETPSFLGLSLREALARAQVSGWDVRVTGTGYVAAQQPMPGTRIVAERRLALRLSPVEAIASP